MADRLCQMSTCADRAINEVKAEGTELSKDVCGWHVRWGKQELQSDLPGHSIVIEPIWLDSGAVIHDYHDEF